MISIYSFCQYIMLIGVLTMLMTRVSAQRLDNRSIKKNIHPIENPAEKIGRLDPKCFEYDHKRYQHLNLQKGPQYGFIAEEVQSIFPELVTEKTITYPFGKNVYRSATVKVVHEPLLIPLLVAALNEQKAELGRLKLEIERLKKTSVLTRETGAGADAIVREK